MFRQREGACLLKTPDLVLQDFHAPRSFTLVDVSRLWILLPPHTSRRRPNQLFIVIELLRLLVPVTTLGHLGAPPLVLA